MAKDKEDQESRPSSKPLVWLHGEIKTPPFAEEGRKEAGFLLRFLQEGEKLEMPQAEPLPILGPRCGALRIRDARGNWRIMYRIDQDAIVILEVYAKKTSKIPQEIIERCKKRLRDYDEIRRAAEQAGAAQKPSKKGK